MGGPVPGPGASAGSAAPVMHGWWDSPVAAVLLLVVLGIVAGVLR